MQLLFSSKKYQINLKWFLIFIFIISLSSLSYAQEKKTKPEKNKKSNIRTETEFNDANTPLHLLQADYSFDYKLMSAELIESKMEHILQYLSSVTPTEIINKKTQESISELKDINRYSQLKKGDFRLTSYEWGVTYAAMLRMAQVTDNDEYLNYTRERFAFLAEAAPYFKKQLEEEGVTDPLMTRVLQPKAP